MNQKNKHGEKSENRLIIWSGNWWFSHFEFRVLQRASGLGLNWDYAPLQTEKKGVMGNCGANANTLQISAGRQCLFFLSDFVHTSSRAEVNTFSPPNAVSHLVFIPFVHPVAVEQPESWFTFSLCRGSSDVMLLPRANTHYTLDK